MIMLMLVLVALHAGVTSTAVGAGVLRLRVDLGGNMFVIPCAGDRGVVGVVTMVSVVPIMTVTRARSVRLHLRSPQFIGLTSAFHRGNRWGRRRTGACCEHRRRQSRLRHGQRRSRSLWQSSQYLPVLKSTRV